MDLALRELVRERARGFCEYCQIPEQFMLLPFQIDHIIAEKHQGPTEEGNLAWSCERCNSHKGPNISGYFGWTARPAFQSASRYLERSFHWKGGVLEGRSDMGEVTIQVLNVNLPNLIILREALIEEDVFPPQLER